MSKFGITRVPGESEEDFQRRYCREKMRIYRAAKPKSDRKRGKGKKPLKNSLLTQEEWELLRQRPDESDAEYKRRSSRERMRIWRSRPGNLDKQAARAREAYAENPAAARAYRAAYRKENPDVQRRADKRQMEKNPGKKLASLKEWGAKNPDKLRAAQQRWNAANRALLASYSAAWRRAARIATPPWADFEKITAFYVEARRLTEETGIEHQVDHIVPLQGRGVRGLHVHTNLRVVTASENNKKRNRLDHDLVERLTRADISNLGE